MSTERTITVKAADGTLTIAELRQFLRDLDQAVTTETAEVKPKARVSFGGHLKSITVKVQG